MLMLIVLSACLIGFWIYSDKKERAWKGEAARQLWTERVRLILAYVMSENMKITFYPNPPDASPITGHLLGFSVRNRGDIVLEWDRPDLAFDLSETQNYPLRVQCELPGDSSDSIEFRLEHPSQEYSGNSSSPSDPLSYTYFDKSILRGLRQFEPDKPPGTAIGIRHTQGGWKRKQRDLSATDDDRPEP